MDLADANQPVFALGALVVAESKWLQFEKEVTALIDHYFPPLRPVEFELHASELINPRGYFRQFAISHRLEFFDAALKIVAQLKLPFIYRAIIKKRYHIWLRETFGPGVSINPHVAAFALVAQVISEHLRSLPEKPLGIFIFDDNKEVAADVEKSIRLLRADKGQLRLAQIIEKGFFIDSRTSLPLQICDLCIYAARRAEEMKAGFRVKELDRTITPWIEPLVHRGRESFSDVIAWLEVQQKKERPGA